MVESSDIVKAVLVGTKQEKPSTACGFHLSNYFFKLFCFLCLIEKVKK